MPKIEHIEQTQIIIILKGQQCKAERQSDIHPISPKRLAQQYQPIDRRRERKKE